MKIPKQGSTYSAKKNPSINTMKLDISTLDIFCRYIISNPSLIKLAEVVDLNIMIQGLDPSTYKDDPDKLDRINFIKRGIEARLQYNLSDRQLILNYITSAMGKNPDFVDLVNELTKDDLESCHRLVEDATKFSFVYGHCDDFIDLCTKIKTTDFSHRGFAINNFENLLDLTKNEFRKANQNDNILDMAFSLRSGKFENNIREVYNVVTAPSRRLLTGMQGFNAMTGGGLEAGRVYILFGVTGVGKSVTLLNMLYQIKKYNSNYQLKDPSKVPCVVYLTMENSVVETVTRLFDMTTDSQFGMGSYTVDEVIKKFKEEGQLAVTENSPIDIVIKYKPNRSVNTSYLYSLYDDLSDDGYEPICLIQDHLLRIRSMESTNEPRFELGNIVNEFKTFATEKDIPVISNFHLNREAMKTVETYANKSTHIDITQKLGKSNVSESVMIINNCDCGITINKEYDDQGQVYMGFNLIKMRDKTNVFYFAQPFAYGTEIKLIEDINGPAMYKTSVHGNSNVPKIDNVRTSSANAMRSINNITSNNASPIDMSFMDNAIYNNIEDDNISGNVIDLTIEDPEILKPAVVSPFMFGLKKEDPTEAINSGMSKLEEMKAKLNARKARPIPTKAFIPWQPEDEQEF